MFENLNAFVQNPLPFFAKTKFNIPQGANSPDEIINYLLQTRQLTQDQYNAVYSKYKDLQSSGQLPQR